MNRRMACYGICVLLALAIQDTQCAVRLPRLIGSGMVLQRNSEVRIWGWASPEEGVVIRFLGKNLSTRADADGQWAITLPPMKAGGPYAMEIDGTNHIVLNDILIGDVWVCSGQSNMELPMARVKPRYGEVIAHSANPNIRQFGVPHRYDFAAPQSDLPHAEWVAANPWSILRFTATGYFFARSLWEKHHVPIGLINASVGGTPIQSWMSRDALKEFPSEIATAEKFADTSYRDSVNRDNFATADAWNSRLWDADKGLTGDTPWFDPSYNSSAWPTMELPGFWDQEGLKDVHGVVWFRREFQVPTRLAGKEAQLLMGRIVDADYDYINGVFVGSVSYQYPPRRYTVAAGMLKAGTNTIVVRVINSGGRGGFIKDKPYRLIIASDTINLAGKWTYAVGATAEPMRGPTVIEYQPIGFFNGMISPLLPYAIKGALWYQGESNCSHPDGYFKMLTSMITDWRKRWNEGDFPFLIVQLPNYGEAFNHPTESGWAEVRDAELKALALPNTGMAVTIDVGEWNDIHPLDKSDVGKRLALAAEKVAYGAKALVASGPIYKSMTIEGDKAILTFTDVGKGLVARGGGPLRRFEIAGKDGKFMGAKARIKGNTIVVWSDAVQTPARVRYAWADNPSGANLYNREGLPASPFETGR